MLLKPNHCFSSPRTELIRACIPEQADNWRTWLPQGTSHGIGIGNAEQQQQPAEAEDQPMESSTAPQQEEDEEHAEEEIEYLWSNENRN
jgi:hypothetical protein